MLKSAWVAVSPGLEAVSRKATTLPFSSATKLVSSTGGGSAVSHHLDDLRSPATLTFPTGEPPLLYVDVVARLGGAQ